MNKENWKLVYSRGMSVQRAIDFSISIGPEFEKAFGFGMMHHKIVLYNGNLEGYCLKDEFELFLKKLKRTLADAGFQKKFKGELRRAIRKVEEFPALARCTNDSNETIIIKLLKAKKIKVDLFIIPWFTFMMDNPLDELLSEIVARYPGLRKESFVGITRQTVMIKEKLDLLMIAGKPSHKKIMTHMRKYSFIPMYDTDYSGYDFDYFKDQIKKIKNIQHAREEILLELKKNQLEFRRALAKVRPEDKSFLKFANFLIWLREEKIVFRNKEAAYLKPLYLEISRRLGISLTEVINLTYDEIISGLKAGRVDKSTIEQRKKSFELLINREQLQIINDSKIEEVKADKEVLLKGQIAMKGKATGPAKIIMNGKELYKINTEDIMITPMTKPDFITAIRKCSAIVTDEGGITCHAAIVARELKKPCIIGTKIATKVLKDNDMIEVDANKGIVRFAKVIKK